jgi:diguanylate cyclase (GGDEF)-like protein
MAVTSDELARRRALVSGHPSVFRREDRNGLPRPAELAHSSASSAPDLRELERRCLAAKRVVTETAAALSDVVWRAAAGDTGAELGLRSAHDRAAAAQDRLAAARDRLVAAELLGRAGRDRLTEALSRDAGSDQLQQLIDRAAREHAPLVVAFVDVDGLKRLNDERGHAAGDAALRAVGLSLRRCLRGYDLVARFGGDEFVCGLPGLPLEEALNRFEQVAEALDELCPGTRISVGLAAALAGDGLEAVLRRADADLYAGRAARRGGRQGDAALVPGPGAVPRPRG